MRFLAVKNYDGRTRFTILNGKVATKEAKANATTIPIAAGG